MAREQRGRWRHRTAVAHSAFQDMHQLCITFIRMELRWLLPTLGVLLLLALGMALAGGAGPLAPFIYPLF